MLNADKDFIEPELIAESDEDALTRIYECYRDRVYGFAYRMLGTQTIAEEITQEAFLVLIKRLESYEPTKGSMLTFLCAIARNHILMYFRSRGDALEDAFDELNFIPANKECGLNPLSSLLEQELAAKVNDSILMLPALQREAIILREFQEMTYEEISVVTGVDVNVVKARLYRARQSLARRLAPYVGVKGEGCYELRRS